MKLGQYILGFSILPLPSTIKWSLPKVLQTFAVQASESVNRIFIMAADGNETPYVLSRNIEHRCNTKMPICPQKGNYVR